MAKTKSKAKVAQSAPKAKAKSKASSVGKSTRASAPVPRSTRVTTPADPPAPAPAPAAPPPRNEPAAERDIGRLLRYGERFGAYKIDTRMWSAAGALQPTTLPVPTGAIAICDPAAPKTWRVLDRPAGTGQFRIMLSVAKSDAGEKLAALVIHTGRPPIARWTAALPAGKKQPSPIAIASGWIALVDAGAGSPGAIATPPADGKPGIEPVEVPLTDGRKAIAVPCGNGEFTAYWAIDAADKPIALVIDFDAFTQKEWRAKPAS